MGAFDCELARLGYRSTRHVEQPGVMDTYYLMWNSKPWGCGSRSGAHYKHKSSAVRRYWKEYHAGNNPCLWFKCKGFEKGRHI